MGPFVGLLIRKIILKMKTRFGQMTIPSIRLHKCAEDGLLTETGLTFVTRSDKPTIGHFGRSTLYIKILVKLGL